MALEQNYAPKHWTDKGLSFEGAYYRVASYAVNTDQKRAEMVIQVWKDADTRNAADAQPLDLMHLVVENTPGQTDDLGNVTPAKNDYDELFSTDALSADGVNAQAQCYVAAKRSPLFSGARDV